MSQPAGSRRDAVRNRARIVAAAETAFREGGAGVALDRVAELAGVGRATLYRHFPDRASLVAAVFGMRVDALERHAARLPAERRLDHLVAEIAELQLDAPGLVSAVLGSAQAVALFADVERRTVVLLGAAVQEARGLGRLRADVTVEDVTMVFAVVEGVIAAAPPERAAASVQRAIDLWLRALLTAEAWHGAPPATMQIPTTDVPDRS